VAYRKKKVDVVSKKDVSNEHEEFEELVKDILQIHDKLLKMGFEEIADDALEIHNNLLGTKKEEAKNATTIPEIVPSMVFCSEYGSL